MQRNINEEENVIKGMLFDGMSFSTFKFDSLAILCCKYYLSFIKFMKKKYLKEIYRSLNGKEMSAGADVASENHYISHVINALKESNVLFSKDKFEIFLYKLVKNKRDSKDDAKVKRDIIVVEDFNLSDIPYNINTRSVCLVINNDNDKNKYKDLIKLIPDIKFVSLDDNTEGFVIFDVISTGSLRDESDIYFVAEGPYSNYIVNTYYNRDKIGINL